VGAKGNIHVYKICREMLNDKRFEEFKKVGGADKARLYCEALMEIDSLKNEIEIIRRVNK
jgi:hypothetical protein